MQKIIYKVTLIDGDYAVLESDGVKNRIARALLPYDIEEGDTVIYENFEYTIDGK